VRYVIDFYRGKEVEGAPVAMFLDTRPAIDGPEGIVDRARKIFQELVG
jgi:hypothetical protein